MSKHTQHEGFEAKVRSMAEGFRGMREQGTELVFKSESMVPMQAAQRLQVIADHFQSIRDAEEVRRVAVEGLEEGMDAHHAFYGEAVDVVKSHFGSDPKRLATFGLGTARKPQRRGRPARREREVMRSTLVEEVIVDEGRDVEVLRSEEVIETTEPGRGERRPRRERSAKGAVPSSSPPAVVPSPTAPKNKAGPRR